MCVGCCADSRHRRHGAGASSISEDHDVDVRLLVSHDVWHLPDYDGALWSHYFVLDHICVRVVHGENGIAYLQSISLRARERLVVGW